MLVEVTRTETVHLEVPAFFKSIFDYQSVEEDRILCVDSSEGSHKIEVIEKNSSKWDQRIQMLLNSYQTCSADEFLSVANQAVEKIASIAGRAAA